MRTETNIFHSYLILSVASATRKWAKTEPVARIDLSGWPMNGPCLTTGNPEREVALPLYQAAEKLPLKASWGGARLSALEVVGERGRRGVGRHRDESKAVVP